MTGSNTVLLEGQQLGRKRPLFADRQIEVPENWLETDDGVTLRELLKHLVSLEVEAFQEGQERQQLFRVLSAEEIETGKAAGRISPEGKTEKQTVDAQDAVQIAWQAFEDGLFFVIVDGEQIEALDEAVHLQENSSMKFVRLVALAGG